MLEVSLEKGKFVDVKGNFDNFSSERIVGQGWTITKKNKAIEAYSSNGEYELKAMFFPNGRFVLTRKSSKGEEILKNTLLENTLPCLIGTIYLSGTSDFEKRKVTFRSAKFEKFLKKNNLITFSKKNPNRLYKVRNIIYTDGVIIKKGRFLNVNDATWLISENKGGRYLYSKVDYTDLKLPIIVDSNKDFYLRNLRKKFKTIEDAKKYLHWYFNNTNCEDFEYDDSIQADISELRVVYKLEEDENTIYTYVYKYYYWKKEESSRNSGLDDVFYSEKRKMYFKKCLVHKAESGIIFA